MQCPYCKNEMEKGILSGDGRRKVCWHKDGEKIRLIDALVCKGIIEANYTWARFEIVSHYCYSCHKMIFDTKVL